MSSSEDEKLRLYTIVVNGNEQYSIWPAERELPDGWNRLGVKGPKKQCLEFIQEVWTDMSPLKSRMEKELV